MDGKPRDRELLTAFAASVSDPIVEIGSGPGQVGAFVRAHGRRVVGLDVSAAMARRALERLDGSVAADMRRLPLADARVGGVLAFYSVIHVPRAELEVVLAECRRVLCLGGRLLVAVHEGEGEIERDEFLDEPVPFVATLFTLDELVAATTAVGLVVTLAERRPSYETESGTVRLYVEAEHRPTR